MKLLADLHTHSKFSRFGHGKSSIEEMVIRANELGLKELAITDHGYKHFFRTSKKNMIEARKIIDEINTWSKTKILLGIEADILNEKGDLDIDEETLNLIDILVVGYHRMISTNFAGYFGHQKKSNQAIEKATNAYINAIDRYPVTIISHIDSILRTDLYKIGKVCKDKGVYIEINNRHTDWSETQIEELISSDCSFVVSSDAHSDDAVGVVEHAFDIIKKYKIPAESIANVEFEETELTKSDKENLLYSNLYESLREKNPELYAQINATIGDTTPVKQISVEITNEKGKLSKEMEDALEKIAIEKGFDDYQRQDGNVSVKYEDLKTAINDEQLNHEINELNLEAQTDFNSEEKIEENSSIDENFQNLSNQNNTVKANDVHVGVDNSSSQKNTLMNQIQFNKNSEKSSSVDNFISDDPVLSIQNSLNQFKGGFNPNRYRDSQYQNANNQEEQVEMLKSYDANETAKNKSDYEYEQTNNVFFEDDFGSQNFNVNDKSYNRTSVPTSKVEINKNFTVPNANKNTTSSANFQQNFNFNKSNNTSENLNNSQNQANSSSSNQSVPKKTNGFVSFSNFNDDDK